MIQILSYSEYIKLNKLGFSEFTNFIFEKSNAKFYLNIKKAREEAKKIAKENTDGIAICVDYNIDFDFLEKIIKFYHINSDLDYEDIDEAIILDKKHRSEFLHACNNKPYIWACYIIEEGIDILNYFTKDEWIDLIIPHYAIMWDTAGLIDGVGAPLDEYSSEIAHLLQLIKNEEKNIDTEECVLNAFDTFGSMKPRVNNEYYELIKVVNQWKLL